MKKPLVTIVMPVYNVAPYIERALLSAIRQTYSNLEIILVDDCGKDDSIPIAERLIAQYDTNRIVRIIHHDHNRGLSAARNTGLDNMRGEYVYFMDSDDEITVDCIEQLEALAEKYPKAEMVIGNMSVPIYPNDSEEKKKEGRDFSHFPEYADDRDWMVRYMFDYSGGYFIPSTSVNKLQKKSFFEDNQLRFVEGLIHEDEKMTFDCAECVKSMAFYAPVTYIRYMNAGSIMTSMTSIRSLDNWIKIIKSSYPRFQDPHKSLKLIYCITEILNRSLDLPKKDSLTAIIKSKSLVIKLSKELTSLGYKNTYRYMGEYLLLPHRLMRLSRKKNNLREKYSLANMKKNILDSTCKD